MRAASRARLFLAGLIARHSTAWRGVLRPGAAAGEGAGVPGRRAALPVTASDHLDALARALTAAGWSVSPRYDERPALLRVVAPEVPCFGESVWVKPGVGGVPWFISSTGDPLAPCHDLPRAVTEIGARLAPLAIAAAARRPAGAEQGALSRCLVSSIWTFIRNEVRNSHVN
ncbi:hypothetical protein [Actinomadura rubrisoli]|uniref:Uncharacterized protein n=1 Tax=Actinomadura rubrisoli TaxID=2530368 RepID=A0A4R5AT29_9ACTN|nr:hypothetical protein [Actinomadura rubrisoli]TDD76161.1 hypothetical protein E1298_31070 [Actinomadura rubrisoli]